MYDFKYHIHNNQRFNTYEIYTYDNRKPIGLYKIIRNILFSMILLLGVLIFSIFSIKYYQQHLQKQSINSKKEMRINSITNQKGN